MIIHSLFAVVCIMLSIFAITFHLFKIITHHKPLMGLKKLTLDSYRILQVVTSFSFHSNVFNIFSTFNLHNQIHVIIQQKPEQLQHVAKILKCFALYVLVQLKPINCKTSRSLGLLRLFSTAFVSIHA